MVMVMLFLDDDRLGQGSRCTPRRVVVWVAGGDGLGKVVVGIVLRDRVALLLDDEQRWQRWRGMVMMKFTRGWFEDVVGGPEVEDERVAVVLGNRGRRRPCSSSASVSREQEVGQGSRCTPRRVVVWVVGGDGLGKVVVGVVLRDRVALLLDDEQRWQRVVRDGDDEVDVWMLVLGDGCGRLLRGLGHHGSSAIYGTRPCTSSAVRDFSCIGRRSCLNSMGKEELGLLAQRLDLLVLSPELGDA
ncbi:hypothetical protein Dimus_007184 [Dionaea muscipula]